MDYYIIIVSVIVASKICISTNVIILINDTILLPTRLIFFKFCVLLCIMQVFRFILQIKSAFNAIIVLADSFFYNYNNNELFL